MLPAVNSLAGKVLMTCKCIDNSWSFREESRGKAPLLRISRGASLGVQYRAIGAERFWDWRLSYRFGSISYEDGWSRPGRPTQGHVELGGNYMGGLEITIGTQTPRLW